MAKNNENMATISNLIGDVPPPKLIGREVCEGCEEEMLIYEAEILGGPNKGKKHRYKKGCKCTDYFLARKEIYNRNKLKQERIQRIFDQNSLIPPKLKKSTFEGYLPKNKTQTKARDLMMEYVTTFDPEESRNIILTGDYGIGKSHLCVATIKALMKRGNTAIFCAVPTLMAKIRSTFKKDSETTEDELMDFLQKVDILVLDDLGAETPNDWRNEILLQIIASRMGMHTIYTTNLDSGQLEDHLRARNFSKILEDTEIIKLTGKDQRIKK